MGGFDARKTTHCADRLIDKHLDLRIVIVFLTAVLNQCKLSMNETGQ